ncbi:general secretion pathway protein G [Chitinivorax tropicus]|uniref:General secretion pathway protein G n=1 Tax=Chitinivorax tropicus TaxID=714531 RepID=A0A840MM75_9PROT|nr:type II secretion system protein [Chitinivorax tropicus]MBB5017812.1 general secretion pathway protein G [Chitinivorax tropicus]
MNTQPIQTFRNGFTLMEVLVTLAIIAILATMATPIALNAAKKQKEAELKQALTEIRKAIDTYKADADTGRIAKLNTESHYPRSLPELANGVPDEKNPGKKIFYLRQIPRDPFFKNKEVAPEKTWGLRNSQSPRDNPQPGDDVFSVYSTSPDKGLNGIPYKDW